MTNFDIETFQVEVLEQFHVLKRTYEQEKDFHNMINTRGNLPKGCLNHFFLNIGTVFGRRAFKEIGKRGGDARILLSRKEVQTVLCVELRPMLEKLAPNEEDFIRTIVNTLATASLREDIQVPLDAEIFALLSYELLLIGPDDYCTGI